RTTEEIILARQFLTNICRQFDCARSFWGELAPSSARQIGGAHMWIVDEVASAPRERQRPGLQQIGMIAHFQCGQSVLLDHQNSRSRIANAGNDIEGSLHNVWSKAK